MAPGHASGERSAGGTSDVFRLLALDNHVKINRWGVVRVQLLNVNLLHLHHYALQIAPGHPAGEGLVVWGTSDVLRLLALTNHLTFRHRDLVCIPGLRLIGRI